MDIFYTVVCPASMSIKDAFKAIETTFNECKVVSYVRTDRYANSAKNEHVFKLRTSVRNKYGIYRYNSQQDYIHLLPWPYKKEA